MLSSMAELFKFIIDVSFSLSSSSTRLIITEVSPPLLPLRLLLWMLELLRLLELRPNNFGLKFLCLMERLRRATVGFFYWDWLALRMDACRCLFYWSYRRKFDFERGQETCKTYHELLEQVLLLIRVHALQSVRSALFIVGSKLVQSHLARIHHILCGDHVGKEIGADYSDVGGWRLRDGVVRKVVNPTAQRMFRTHIFLIL
jgi:hypothetical protein